MENDTLNKIKNSESLPQFLYQTNKPIEEKKSYGVSEAFSRLQNSQILRTFVNLYVFFKYVGNFEKIALLYDTHIYISDKVVSLLLIWKMNKEVK